LADDPLAHLAMTEQGIVKRDWLVIEACRQRNVPIVMTLGGGYSRDAWHAQYMSIRNIIEKDAQELEDARPRVPRSSRSDERGTNEAKSKE
jgi:acetoin utilization deacetylase AcuC-like enzyme